MYCQIVQNSARFLVPRIKRRLSPFFIHFSSILPPFSQEKTHPLLGCFGGHGAACCAGADGVAVAVLHGGGPIERPGPGETIVHVLGKHGVQPAERLLVEKKLGKNGKTIVFSDENHWISLLTYMFTFTSSFGRRHPIFRDPFVKGRESTEFGRGFSNETC